MVAPGRAPWPVRQNQEQKVSKSEDSHVLIIVESVIQQRLHTWISIHVPQRAVPANM